MMMKPNHGFTLLEMMVVIAILGAVIISVPNILQWLRYQGVQHAADQLRCDLQLARMMAIRQKQTCALLFNHPAAGQYTNSLNNKTVHLSAYRGGVHFLRNGPGNDAMSSAIKFSRRGMAVPAGDIYLADQDNQNIFRILVLVPGGISVLRWNGRSWQ